MRKILVATLSSAALLTVAGTASADVQTSTINVSAQVQKNCILTSTDINFGTYTPGSGTALTANGTVTVRCSKNSPYVVTLSAGNGTYANRLLKNGTDALQYNLYTDNAHTIVWGDGSSGSVTVPGTGAGVSVASQRQVTVYGQLPDNATNQDVNAAASGSFTDAITVTVTY